MKYFIIDHHGQEEQGLLHEIADFLWNNGNEVVFANNVQSDCNKMDKPGQSDYYDCTVSLVDKDAPIELLFERQPQDHNNDQELNPKLSKALKLIFANKGIYTNAIPYPHKIFHFERLDRNALTAFFSWCKKL